jgi:hypothetical protein
MKNYVYAFDCAAYCGFFGENSLTKGGRLYCPNCLCEQRISSPYVEKISVLYAVEAFSRKALV